jgi:CheY-like chemotaxis protein
MSTTLDRDLWLTDVDPGEVDHALINLALNARDAMPDGGKLAISSCNISLDAEAAARIADAHPGDYVQLTLTDTGQGMPAEVLARAVEPFFTTKEGKGSGLGLSSVHGFCKQSGGFLSISSAVGQGTAVSIHLPKSSFRVPPDLARPAAQQIPIGDGELILVVEDNNELREIASSYLESLDYTVLEARDGSDAIKILETEEPVALVFSDVVMPGGVSGYDIAKWLETHKHKAKIVLTSGYNDVDRTARGIDGEIVLLGKPYNREQLAREVHAALRRA